MIKRFLIIGLLAVWLPMNLGTAQIKIREYDGSQEPEKWFFDNAVRENGELFLNEYIVYLRYNFDEALPEIVNKRFHCIPTHERVDKGNEHEKFLNYHINDVTSKPPLKFALHDNHYLVFRACRYRACPDQSQYIFDMKNRDLAIATIDGADIFIEREGEDYFKHYDGARPYTKLFISPNATEEFIKESTKFAKEFQEYWGQSRRDKVESMRELQTYKVDCRTEN